MVHTMNLRGKAIAYYFRRRTRRRFARVMARGLERLDPWRAEGLATGPLVIVANHSSWWDAVLPLLLSRFPSPIDAFGMMEKEQLERFGFFRHVGMLPVERNDPRAALRSLQRAALMMSGEKKALWIFPQGRILPNDRRPLGCERGAAHLVAMIGGCSIVPVALRYETGVDELPVAWASVGEPWRVEEGALVRELAVRIESSLTVELDGLRDDLTAERHDRFRVFLPGSVPMTGIRGT